MKSPHVLFALVLCLVPSGLEAAEYHMELLVTGSAINPSARDWRVPDHWVELQIGPHEYGTLTYREIKLLLDDNETGRVLRASMPPYDSFRTAQITRWEKLPNAYTAATLEPFRTGDQPLVMLISPLPQTVGESRVVVVVHHPESQVPDRVSFHGDDGMSVQTPSPIKNFEVYLATKKK